MRNIPNTNYLGTRSLSGSVIFGNDTNIFLKEEEDYKTKNLNEETFTKQTK